MQAAEIAAHDECWSLTDATVRLTYHCVFDKTINNNKPANSLFMRNYLDFIIFNGIVIKGPRCLQVAGSTFPVAPPPQSSGPINPQSTGRVSDHARFNYSVERPIYPRGQEPTEAAGRDYRSDVTGRTAESEFDLDKLCKLGKWRL